MNDLTVSGLAIVADMKFHHIEGGFGESAPSMSARDIARIHGKELKHINQAINMNRKRFRDGVDVIDLKLGQFDGPTFESLGFSKQAVANSSNIYILSERGYAKLLKILEDDLAWEKYDLLVDGYFQMRKAVKETPAALDAIKAEAAKQRAEAMSLNAKTRAYKAIMSTLDKAKYSDLAAQVFGLKAIEQITGQKIAMQPEFVKSWTATDVAKETGLCASTVGKIAVAAGLKEKQYGQAILNQVPGRVKQVPEFHYNEEGHGLLLAACDQWKADHTKKLKRA